MKYFNFCNKSDGVNSKIKIIIGLVVLGLAVLILLKYGIIGSYIQFQERPLDTILYGIMGVAFCYNNFTALILSALLGWFLFGLFYVDSANKYNRNPTWAFFYGVFFGVVAGFFYIPYLWVVGKKKDGEDKRSFILALMICVIICVVAFFGYVVLQGQSTSSKPATQFDSAGALYSKSVDLANAGKYSEALQASDQALAQNIPSLIPLIQANRAGILVMLGKYEEANAAADVAIAAPGNITTTWSIAYYNKGDALRHLGRIEEAKLAYAKAAELDPTLVNPYQK